MRSDWLDAFLVFGNELNFTKAAEKLNISQPALHVKIQKLSDDLGIPLYFRQGRGLRLTPAGRRLAAFAQEQQMRSADFVSALRGNSQPQPVRLCAGDGAYLYLLGPALRRFMKAHKNGISLLTGNQTQTFELLLSGDAHLGVSAPDAVPDLFASEPLTRVGQMVVMPKSHRLARRRRLILTDLEGEALIVPPQDRPHRVMINRILMDASVSWHVAVEANGWELMQHFAQLGFGLAIINDCCRLRPGLTARPVDAFPAIQYQILWRRDATLTSPAENLLRVLRKERDAWQKPSTL